MQMRQNKRQLLCIIVYIGVVYKHHFFSMCVFHPPSITSRYEFPRSLISLPGDARPRVWELGLPSKLPRLAAPDYPCSPKTEMMSHTTPPYTVDYTLYTISPILLIIRMRNPLIKLPKLNVRVHKHEPHSVEKRTSHSPYRTPGIIETCGVGEPANLDKVVLDEGIGRIGDRR